jgi:gliding motility-associated-like protein
MNKFFMLLVGIISPLLVSAQNPVFGLDFEDCMIRDITSNFTTLTQGSPECVCGPFGSAMRFDGVNDGISIDDTLRLGGAFSLQMTFQPLGSERNQVLFSYFEACNSTRGMNILYDALDNSLSFQLIEDLSKQEFFVRRLDPNLCWHSLVFYRTGNTYVAYLNGELILDETGSSFISIENPGAMTIGTGPCVPAFASNFEGIIDEFYIYDELIPIVQLERYIPNTDQILTRDTLLFIGDSFVPRINAECASDFRWDPVDGISDPNEKEPEIGPETAGIYFYYLTMTEASCETIDSIRVIVVDPEDVNCEKLILPSAFSPNGDDLNESYFISNGFIIDELIRFEIFDRWGERLFSTKDINEGWDGTFKGEVVMPGVYVYKAEFNCNGNTEIQVGSFSVLN